MTRSTTVVALLAALSACGPQPAQIVVGSDDMTVHTLEAIPLPGVQVLDAEGVAIPEHAPVTWSASPADVGALDLDAGVLVPAADGAITVTATLGALTDAFTVTVSLPDAVAITAASTGDLAPGASVALTAEVRADGLTLADLKATWTSADPAIATVTPEGVVQAVADGETRVTATYGALQAEHVVTVVTPAEVVEVVEAN